MKPVKESCAFFDSDSGTCIALDELMCDKKGRCSFFCTEVSALTSYRRYCEIMRLKPKKVQRRFAKVYYGGKMPWNKI